MEIRHLDLKSFFFISLLILLGFLMLQLFGPFLNIVVVALVIVQLFYPIYRYLLKLTKNSGLASLITTLITVLFVILPIIVIILFAASEISSVIGNVSTSTQGQVAISPALQQVEQAVRNVIASLNANLDSWGIGFQIQRPDFGQIGYDLLQGIQNSLLPLISSLVSISLGALFTTFLFIMTLLYMFVDYENLRKFLSRISPLDDELDELLFTKFTETNRAVLRGSFVIALAQASSVSVMLILLGIGAPVLLWVIMVLLSLIPVGSGLVWAPVGLGLILSGQPVAGILLIVYSAVIINVVDAVLRPQLMKGATQLHPLVIIFSALGGISLFGPLGLLYGPIIAVFFASLMEIYTQRYTGGKVHHEVPKY